MQKRGAEINITTIIIIILALLVLVIIALYFTGGIKSLWEQITGKKAAWDTAKVEEARIACKMACSANNLDYFCTHLFKVEKNETEGKGKTCDEAPINAWKLEECRDAGFTKEKCEEYRRGEYY